jgi:hypothetical protein
MRVRRKRPCLPPSGCKADLHARHRYRRHVHGDEGGARIPGGLAFRNSITFTRKAISLALILVDLLLLRSGY